MKSIVLFAILIGPIGCPFPPEHPYNHFNPIIEPWWNRLTQAERKAIYAYWKPLEPLAIGWADLLDAKIRTKASLFRLFKAKANHLKAIMAEKKDTLKTSSGEYIYDQEVGKYKTPQLIALEQKKAEAQEFLFWKQTAQSAKLALYLEKLRLLNSNRPEEHHAKAKDKDIAAVHHEKEAHSDF